MVSDRGFQLTDPISRGPGWRTGGASSGSDIRPSAGIGWVDWSDGGTTQPRGISDILHRTNPDTLVPCTEYTAGLGK